jgi:hypothetical protein
MFHEEFFPTPKSVIRKLIEPYKKGLTERVILEPSAGKGDIIDYIKANGSEYYQPDIYAIEQSEELKSILHGKGIRVIGSDFLQYHGDFMFDLILMNPPFSNGDEHLLKAWDILDSGDIACVLNSETINNPYTERRQHLAKLIEKHGSVEHLGAEFIEAERSTRVEVCIVRLKKAPKEKRFDFKFERLTSEEGIKLDEETFKNPIATRDVIGNMETQFKKVKELFAEYLKIQEALKFYSEDLFSKNLGLPLNREEKTLEKKYNGFCDDLRQMVWNHILGKTKAEKFMTSGVREDFKKFSTQQGYMDFTKQNVMELVSFLFQNSGAIMERAIVEVFDMVTSHNEDNRYMVEGWKTNSKWKVNKKIIFPYGVELDQDWMKKGYSSKFHVPSRGRWERYSDIDKVMCYITGEKFDREENEGERPGIVRIEDALNRRFEEIGHIHTGAKFDNTCESHFFKIKFWMKGTMHLEFKDKDLWEEFNMRACAGKQWLPETEKKEYEKRKQTEREKQQPKPAPKPELIALPEPKTEGQLIIF